jgi:hypothetical protein
MPSIDRNANAQRAVLPPDVRPGAAQAGAPPASPHQLPPEHHLCGLTLNAHPKQASPGARGKFALPVRSSAGTLSKVMADASARSKAPEDRLSNLPLELKHTVFDNLVATKDGRAGLFALNSSNNALRAAVQSRAKDKGEIEAHKLERELGAVEQLVPYLEQTQTRHTAPTAAEHEQRLAREQREETSARTPSLTCLYSLAAKSSGLSAAAFDTVATSALEQAADADLRQPDCFMLSPRALLLAAVVSGRSEADAESLACRIEQMVPAFSVPGKSTEETTMLLRTEYLAATITGLPVWTPAAYGPLVARVSSPQFPTLGCVLTQTNVFLKRPQSARDMIGLAVAARKLPDNAHAALVELSYQHKVREQHGHFSTDVNRKLMQRALLLLPLIPADSREACEKITVGLIPDGLHLDYGDIQSGRLDPPQVC